MQKAVALCLLWTGVALAQAPDAGTPPPEWRTPPPAPAPERATPAPPRFEPYGWNFYFVDPLAVAAMAYGIYSNHGDAVAWGMTAYLLNGPLIHMLLHQRFDLAGASLLNRLGAPLAMLVGLGNVAGAFQCGTASCTRNQTVALFGAGMLVAWGWDILAASSPEAPAPLELSAVLGSTDRGTLTAGFGLQF